MKLDEVKHLLSSNSPPNDLEIATIERGITSRINELAVLRPLVLQLESESEALSSLLAPWRRLVMPPEILAEIFTFVVASIPKDALVPRQVVAISLVCKRWREVALAVPYLWSRVSFTPKSQEGDLPALRRWLDRAKTAPKSLRIEEAPTYKIPHACLLDDPGLARLITETPSIASLFISSDSMPCIQKFISGLVVPATQDGVGKGWPGVQDLTVDVDSWGMESETPEFELAIQQDHFLRHLPPVTSLSLCLPPYEEAPDFARNPYCPDLGHLTRLHLRCDWNVDWVVQLLGTCSNLEDLTIDFKEDGGFDSFVATGAGSVQTIPKLRKLEMLGILHQHSHELEFVKDIKMPSLEQLDMSYEEPMEGDPTVQIATRKVINDLRACVRSSGGGGSLRSLRIYSTLLGDEAFRAIDTFFPNLTALTLDRVACDSTVFKNAAIEKPPFTFPKLEALNLLNIPLSPNFPIYDFRPKDALRFFRARRPTANRPEGYVWLKKMVMTVQLTRNRERYKDTLAVPGWVKDAEGVECQVSWVDPPPRLD